MSHLSGGARVAGVVGSPVRQSLSPLIHNAWIAAAGMDAAYVPFPCPPERFEGFVEGLRGGVIAGLNVTVPFKERALALADERDEAADAAGAANLLAFQGDGRIVARNTDGVGLLAAFAAQAPDWSPHRGDVVVLGAGGAARGAVAALAAAGATVKVVNRTAARASALAADFERVEAVAIADLASVLSDAAAVINATTGGLEGAEGLDIPLQALPPHAVVMDMVYKPLRTPLLDRASALGLAAVDGLAMLIGQAIPSFEAFFGVAPPAGVDVRTLALQALGEARP